MNIKSGCCVAAFAMIANLPAQAGSPHDSIEKVGVDVAIALPVVAGGITIYKNDWQGLAQFATVTAATVGTAYLLKHVVHEERPDGVDDQSFPSDTAALAFAPANYLWDRYGWQYGVPAYAAAAFVGYSRVESKNHHWWDVATSAGMAWGFSHFITSRYHDYPNLEAGLYATPHAAFISASYKF
jgi:membrane-associated phospholipid phosphatase